MSFFSATLFLLCWQQKVKLILNFDKMNKNNKYGIPIVLTAKCKTSLILDKNK